MRTNPSDRRHLALILGCSAAVAVALAGLVLAQDAGVEACRHAGADAGATVNLNLDTMRREYARFKDQFSKTIAVELRQATTLMEQPVDAGLPACRFRRTRSVELATTLPAELRGRTFVFVSADELAAARKIAAQREQATVFVTKAKRLSVLAELSKEIRRSVDIATPELAKAASVGCTPCVVTVNQKGDRLELVEGQ